MSPSPIVRRRLSVEGQLLMLISLSASMILFAGIIPRVCPPDSGRRSCALWRRSRSDHYWSAGECCYRRSKGPGSLHPNEHPQSRRPPGISVVTPPTPQSAAQDQLPHICSPSRLLLSLAHIEIVLVGSGAVWVWVSFSGPMRDRTTGSMIIPWPKPIHKTRVIILKKITKMKLLMVRMTSMDRNVETTPCSSGLPIRISVSATLWLRVGPTQWEKVWHMWVV
mmetsp:Transcript_16521/g.39652  ORF Transcript_16521/g.39652 Transcript_16521/m.39652 type:complete len:223 (+) Transcript_16521:573-1241(+)